MKHVWEEIIKEIGNEGVIAASISLFTLLIALLGLAYVCAG